MSADQTLVPLDYMEAQPNKGLTEVGTIIFYGPHPSTPRYAPRPTRNPRAARHRIQRSIRTPSTARHCIRHGILPLLLRYPMAINRTLPSTRSQINCTSRCSMRLARDRRRKLPRRPVFLRTSTPVLLLPGRGTVPQRHVRRRPEVSRGQWPRSQRHGGLISPPTEGQEAWQGMPVLWQS
jgi:hypothetical protein